MTKYLVEGTVLNSFKYVVEADSFHNAAKEAYSRAEKTAKQLVDKKLDKKFLIDHNVKSEDVGSTQSIRRKQIVEILLNENQTKGDCK